MVQMSDAPLDPPVALSRLRMRQWRLLAQLGADGHLGRAAAALAMTQPAASKLLQQAEEVVGQPLFHRHPRGMAPTGLGDVLVRHARLMVNGLAHVQEEVRALTAGLSGTLRVGCAPGAVPELLAPALVAFKAAHPGVSVSVLVETSDVMLAQLRRGEADLVLGRLTEGHHDDEFESQPLLTEPQVVVVRQGHPLAAGQPVCLQDLAAWPWVLQPPGSPQRARFEAMIREAGIHTRLDITETSSTIATTALLEASDMAAVMPDSLARHYGRLGILQVVVLELPLRVPPIQRITLRRHNPSPAARAFCATLTGSPGTD